MAYDLPFVPVPLLWAKPLSFRIISCPASLPTSLYGTTIYNGSGYMQSHPGTHGAHKLQVGPCLWSPCSHQRELLNIHEVVPDSGTTWVSLPGSHPKARAPPPILCLVPQSLFPSLPGCSAHDGVWTQQESVGNPGLF